MSAELRFLLAQWEGHADGSGEDNPITALEDWLWDHAEDIADLIDWCIGLDDHTRPDEILARLGRPLP